MVEITLDICYNEEDHRCIHYEVCKKRIDIENIFRNFLNEKKELNTIANIIIEFEMDCNNFKTIY